jgi:hypothetical protein
MVATEVAHTATFTMIPIKGMRAAFGYRRIAMTVAITVSAATKTSDPRIVVDSDPTW